jgi:NADH dehydrogenase/NADH:ubiquinone oxidoreductase subunit G
MPLAAIGAVVGIGSTIFGAASSSSSASKNNKAQKEAIKAQYKFDKQVYRDNKSKMNADRDFTIEGIELRKREDAKLKGLKDAQSLDNYGFNLQIRNQQMDNYTKQYDKSQQLYDMQGVFNNVAMSNARIAEQEKMNDAMSQAAFENEDLYVQGLQEQGQRMARGQSGKSGGKARQSLAAQLGRNQNIIMKNLLSSKSEMRTNLTQIATQYEGSKIQNFGNLMIPQTAPPEVLEPYETLTPEYQMPREFEDFDFGPEPVKGTAYQQSTSAPWLSALGSVSSQLISGFSNNGPNMSGGSGLSGASSSGFNLGGNYGGFGGSSTIGGYNQLFG